jgi:hypothetical protein
MRLFASGGRVVIAEQWILKNLLTLFESHHRHQLDKKLVNKGQNGDLRKTEGADL